MPRVVHFEIHADDPERAMGFYKQLFDWEFTVWEGAPYWIIKTGEPGTPGIDGGMVPRRGPIDGQAVTAYVCTVEVASVDDSLAKITELGGQIALAKMPIPGVGWLGYGKDTEGNIFGVMHPDPTASMPAA